MVVSERVKVLHEMAVWQAQIQRGPCVSLEDDKNVNKLCKEIQGFL